MPEPSDPAFVINCPECDMGGEFDDTSAASHFYSKHREHTGHEPEWERADLDVSLANYTHWNVFCDVCAETWSFSSDSEADAFMDEHATYTDHEATGITTESGTRVADVGDLKEVVTEFESATADGMPESLLFTLTDDLEISQSQLSSKIEKLKQLGEIYEPATGHLRTT
ncbi:DUF7542 family protein [Natrinema soli]|nr:hypothetical protein [Natrinema soli]